MKRCMGFFKHKFRMIKGERVCIRCGYLWEPDGESDHRPSKPKPDNSRKKRRERKRTCKRNKRREKLIDRMNKQRKHIKIREKNGRK